MPAAKKPARPLAVGAQIDAIFAKKAEYAAANKVADELKAEITAMELQLMKSMGEQEMPKAAGKRGSVSFSTNIVPNVENWDLFYAFIHKTKQYHLLERRPSTTGCREIFEKNSVLPGVVPFSKTSLNYTATK
jgi:hypothetical protein